MAGARNAQGVSALVWTIYYGQSQLRDLLLTHLDTVDVFEAAALGDAARLETILRATPAAAHEYPLTVGRLFILPPASELPRSFRLCLGPERT